MSSLFQELTMDEKGEVASAHHCPNDPEKHSTKLKKHLNDPEIEHVD